MKKNCDLQKKPFTFSHAVDLPCAVKNIQCHIGSSCNVVLSAGIPFGNVPGCHQDIIFKIMDTFQIFIFFRMVIGDPVQKRNTRDPECFCLKDFYKVSDDNHVRHDQRRIFRFQLHGFGKVMIGHIYNGLVFLQEFLLCDDILSGSVLKDRICEKISHQDQIGDFLVLKIKTLKAYQIISDKFLYQPVIMWSCFLQFFQTFADTKTSHTDTLGQHQSIFIKERDLQISSSDIQDRRTLLNSLFEAGFNGRNGFISQEMLFRITQDFHPDTGSLIDLLQDDHRIFQLTERACCTRTPAFYPKFSHHAFKIIKDLAELIHSLHLKPSCSISSTAQLQLITDIIDLPEADPL